MQDLKNKVAVITGGGSGFGRELALLCAADGMQLVLADVDMAALEGTQALLPSHTETLLQHCDVSTFEAVKALADATYARYGAAHLLFNNAGVAVGGPLWTTTAQDWEWVLGVNLMGVAHGVQAFVPRMLEQADGGHVINTASVAGLLSVPGTGPYCVSKHGVVTLSECLYHELQAAGGHVKVSVLCPAFVKTGIADAARNRPTELADSNPLAGPVEARVRKAVEAGKLSATEVAQITMDAIKADRFYILTHPQIKPAIEARMHDILEERAPTNPMP